MGHIDYNAVTSLDALIDISDAAARASLIALRDRLALLGPAVTERLVIDGQHKKPVLAWYRGDDPLLHVFPEPGAGLGLHVTVPLRTDDRRLIALKELAPWLREAILRTRPRHNTLWVETTLPSPARVDDLIQLLLRRIDFLPAIH